MFFVTASILKPPGGRLSDNIGPRVLPPPRPGEIAVQAASRGKTQLFKKVLALQARWCMIGGMESLDSKMFQTFTARESLSVRTAALLTSVINPWSLLQGEHYEISIQTQKVFVLVRSITRTIKHCQSTIE